MNKLHIQKVRLDKAERTPNGFLKMPAYLTRTGVFKYRNADGSILRELRHPDDVFKKDSLATLAGIPLTNEHPKKLVDPGSMKKDVAGWVGENIDIETIYVKAMVTVADASAIDDVESGKRELSCGYTADLIPEKGIYNGEHYDVRQTNIVYNHVSLVKRGRAGANVKLHLDILESEMIEDENQEFSLTDEEISKLSDEELDDLEFNDGGPGSGPQGGGSSFPKTPEGRKAKMQAAMRASRQKISAFTKKSNAIKAGISAGNSARAASSWAAGNHAARVAANKAARNGDSYNNNGDEMAKIKIGNMDFECSAEMADAFQKEMGAKQTEMDGLKKQIADMMPKAESDKIAAKCDALEAEIKELKTKKDSVEINKEEFEKAVSGRVALLNKAQKLVKKDTKLDGMNELEIMKTVVAEKNPTLDLKEKSEAYIQARFDIICDSVDADVKAQEELNKKVTKQDDKKEIVPAAEARKKMIEDSMSAWKQNSEKLN